MKIWSQFFTKENLVVFLVVVSAFLLRIPFFSGPLDYDEGTYAFFAFFSKGERFYSSLPIARLPGIIFTYRILDNLFPGQIAAFRWAAALLGVLGAFGVYQLGKLLLNPRAGLFSALIFALFSSQVSTDSPANTEFFMMPFAVLAFWLFWLFLKKKKLIWLVLSGLSAGIAVFYKQVAIFEVGLLGLWLLGLRIKGVGKVEEAEKSKRALMRVVKEESVFWGLVCLPIVLALIYFFLRGELTDFWWQSFGSGGDYWLYAWRSGGWLNRLLNTLKFLWFSLWPFWLIGLGGFAIVLTRWQKETIFLVLWVLFAWMGAFFNGWFFPHYFVQIIPPFSLLGGLFLGQIRNYLSYRITTVTLIGFFLLLVLSYQKNYRQLEEERINQSREGGWAPFYQSAEYLRGKMEEKDSLFVWSSTPFPYYLARKYPPTFFVQNYPLLDYQFMVPTYRGWKFDFAANRQKLMEELFNQAPDYLLVDVNPEQVFDQLVVFDKFSRFVSKNYKFEKKFGNILIFKLKEKEKLIESEQDGLLLIPLELIKRFSAVVEIEAKGGQTEITFEPMVNPGGILRSFKAVYPGIVKIDFVPTSGQLLGQDGKDFVGYAYSQPSGLVDLHLKVKGLPKPVSFVRVKTGNVTWNNRHYGVNAQLKVIQNRDIFDLYLEPPLDWRGRTFEIYFIYTDGDLGYTEVTRR